MQVNKYILFFKFFFDFFRISFTFLSPHRGLNVTHQLDGLLVKARAKNAIISNYLQRVNYRFSAW